MVSDVKEDSSFEDIRLIAAGENAEYSKKVQTILNTIESEYYLILLEDFFVGKAIDNTILDDILAYIKTNNIKYYAMPMKEFANNYKGNKLAKGIKAISPKAEYTVSCQPAIWERNFLKTCIGTENYNAWVFEGIYRKSKTAHTKEFLKGCVADLNNPLCIKHGILQGKIVPTTADYFSKVGYSFSTQRELVPKNIYKKQQLKTLFKGILPYWLQKFAKKIFKTNSVVGKYDNTVIEIMNKMELK